MVILEGQTACVGSGRRTRVHQSCELLKTLQVTPRGGMRIDPEELRDQILAAREQYKDLVKKQ